MGSPILMRDARGFSEGLAKVIEPQQMPLCRWSEGRDHT
jgi:hypothetical protein